MLDHVDIGRVDRISPEAPVPVACFDHEEYRLGGAANVANNAATLGARVDLVGLVGNDAAADALRADLTRASIGSAGLVADAARCTTRKLRVVTTRNYQVARVDYEQEMHGQKLRQHRRDTESTDKRRKHRSTAATPTGWPNRASRG